MTSFFLQIASFHTDHAELNGSHLALQSRNLRVKPIFDYHMVFCRRVPPLKGYGILELNVRE